ncbi:MAG: 50S ribosomal protein L10 [Thermodesulfobacteriota bacterium]|nr:50S ribosomal protein L10 [Thermodesulfobacteriota bacterium]
MNRQEKVKEVEWLHEELASSGVLFVTDYLGLNVEEITNLRKKVRESGGSFKVVKNTLLKRAVEGTSASELDPLFTGPTAIAFGDMDPTMLGKALVSFAKKNEQLEIQGGVLDDKVLSAEDVNSLAALPSKQELIAKMLGSLNAPASNFVGVLAAVVRQFMYVLQAIEEKKTQA